MSTTQTTEKAEAHTAEQSAKFTPGPWAVTPDSTCSGAWLVIHPAGDSEQEIFYSETFAIAKSHKTSTIYVEHPEHFKDYESADEIRANARLIAKAPELFAMVRDYAENADCGDGGVHVDDAQGFTPARNCWHCKAIALVAEVEGRAL